MTDGYLSGWVESTAKTKRTEKVNDLISYVSISYN